MTNNHLQVKCQTIQFSREQPAVINNQQAQQTLNNLEGRFQTSKDLYELGDKIETAKDVKDAVTP